MPVEPKDAWQAYMTLSQQAEANSWSRFNNFLMFSSILALGWATIYAPVQRPPGAQVAMGMIALVGAVSGITWAILGWRSREWVRWYYDQSEKIEDSAGLPDDSDLHVARRIRIARDEGLIPMPLFGSFSHLVMAPIVMAVLFVLLLIISIN